jgi:hypothetical protein
MNDRTYLMFILQARPGLDNAITSRQLARQLDLTTREVRQLVADLVDDGALIGASVEGSAGGYYWIETQAELEATRAILRSRAIHILDRDRHLCASWKRTRGQTVQPLLPGLEQ